MGLIGGRLRQVAFGGVALLALLTFALGSALAGPTDWRGLRTLNIAHQGGEDEAPSNTMYSLERAMRLGSDMLELDVHTTADGELVVMHDATVNRTTNGSGRVYDMTLRQVQALDAGHNLVPGEGTAAGRPEADYPFRGVRLGRKDPPPGFKPRDFRIPTLREAMAAYPEVSTNIEIKGAADADLQSFLRNAEALAGFLNDLGRTEGIVVASFNDLALQRFHQLAPQIDLAPGIVSVAAYKLLGLPLIQGTKVFQVPMSFEGIPVTDASFVARAHRDGFGVHVWTINDPPMMKRLLGWGVDGIMTAEPARLERVLCQTDAPRPRRPRSFPGRHCSRRVSIACDVRATRVDRRGRRARISLRRHDNFESRCAGKVALRGIGTGARSSGRFRFGWLPPARGGPAKRSVTVRLKRGLRRALRERPRARVTVRPYTAFVKSWRRLRVR